MGKFLKYEDSNWRSFIIDTTAKTIKRPKRPVTKEDLLGAIVELKYEGMTGHGIITSIVSASQDRIVFVLQVATTVLSCVYSQDKDTFTIGMDGGEAPSAYTNVFIDEFGREEMYI